MSGELQGVSDGATAAGQEETDTPMTTETYRKHHKEEIKRLEEEWGPVDVGHIVSKANGGADDSRNYKLIPRHLNRSIGCRHDDLMFALVGSERTAEAVRVSQQLGGCTLSVSEAQRQGRNARWEVAEKWPGFDAPDSGSATDNPEDEIDKVFEKARHDLQTFEKIVKIWNELNPV